MKTINKFRQLSKTSKALILTNFAEPLCTSLVIGTLSNAYGKCPAVGAFDYNAQTAFGSIICLAFSVWSVLNMDAIVKRFWAFITLDILSTWAVVAYFATVGDISTYWPLAMVVFPKLFQSGINYAFLRFNFTLESADESREFYVMAFCLSCTLGYTLGGNLSFCIQALDLSILTCTIIYALGNSIASFACILFIKTKHLTYAEKSADKL